MGFSGALADLFIQFHVKGLEVVREALGGIHQQLSGLQKGIDAVGQTAKPAFVALSASLTGWVTAGIQGTVVADQLSLRMGQLSRNIAGLFYPELQKAINLVQDAVDWFRSLSAEQRENIARWTMGATAALGVAVVLPRVVAGIQATIAAMQALNVALAIGDALTGNILPIIGAVVSGIAALGIGAAVAEGGLGELLSTLKPLLDALKDVAKTVWEAFKPLLDAAKTILAVFVQALVPVVKLAGSIIAALAAIAKPIFEIFARIVEVVGGFVSMIIEAVSPLFDALGEVAKALGNLFGAVFSLLKPVLEAIVALLTPVVKLFIRMAEVVINVLVHALLTLAEIINTIAEGLAFITGTDLQKVKKAASPDESRGELYKSSSFTSANESYRRIAAQSVAAGFGKPVGERQLDVAQQQLAEQKQTNEILQRQPGAFVRS